MKKQGYPFICFKRILCCVLISALLLQATAYTKAAESNYGNRQKRLSISSYLVLNKNSSYQLNPTLNGASANTSDYTYTTSNKRVARVDSSGLVTTRKKGSARITITSKTNSSLSCSTKIYVGKKITRIRLNYSKKEVFKGNYFMLKASLSPGGAAFKKLEYTSSNTNVARVSSKGKVTGITPGTAVITVRTLDGSNLSKSCTVTILKEPDSTENTSVFPNPFFRNDIDNKSPADKETVTDSNQ